MKSSTNIWNHQRPGSLPSSDFLIRSSKQRLSLVYRPKTIFQLLNLTTYAVFTYKKRSVFWNIFLMFVILCELLYIMKPLWGLLWLNKIIKSFPNYVRALFLHIYMHLCSVSKFCFSENTWRYDNGKCFDKKINSNIILKIIKHHRFRKNRIIFLQFFVKALNKNLNVRRWTQNIILTYENVAYD